MPRPKYCRSQMVGGVRILDGTVRWCRPYFSRSQCTLPRSGNGKYHPSSNNIITRLLLLILLVRGDIHCLHPENYSYYAVELSYILFVGHITSIIIEFAAFLSF